MIFEALNEAAQRGELLLVEGGLLHYHKRRDGTLTIREIVVLPFHRGRGLGRWLVGKAMQFSGCTKATARCPEDLASNGFWKAIGFRLERVEPGRKRRINVWVCDLSSVPMVPQPLPASLSNAGGSTGRVCLPLCTSPSTSLTSTGKTLTDPPTCEPSPNTDL